jgi:hypothetical protein
MTTTHKTPKWITGYLWFTAALTALFCILSYVSPGMLLKDWPAFSAAGALSLAGPLGLYLARNVATFFVTVFSLTDKSIGALKALLILRLVSDTFDCIHNFIGGNIPVAVFGLVMAIIEIFALMKVNALGKD